MKGPLFSLLWVSSMLMTASCEERGQHDAQSTDTRKDTTKNMDVPVDSSQFLNLTSGIRSILEDSQGNWWFGSHSEGVCKYDGKRHTYMTTENGLSDNQIRSIYEDENGTIWFEGGQGLSNYYGFMINTPTNKDYGHKDDWQLGSRDLWFKTDPATGFNEEEGHFGAYRYDGQNLIFHRFPIEVEEGDQFYYSISTPTLRNAGGGVWFGTYGAAIGYDGTSFDIIDNKRLGFSEETGYLHIRGLCEDRHGNLWIANNGIGVLVYDGDSVVNFSRQQDLVDQNCTLDGSSRSSVGLEHVFSIGEDQQGNMWFGDRDSGIWRYDGESMKHFTAEDGVTVPHVWQIYTAASGDLLFAMGDGSVLKFNGSSFDRVF